LPKNVGKYLNLLTKVNVDIGIVIKYFTVIGKPLPIALKLTYCPQAALSLSAIEVLAASNGQSLVIRVNVLGFDDSIESCIVAPYILVS
jgi:hypothetical protein